MIPNNTTHAAFDSNCLSSITFYRLAFVWLLRAGALIVQLGTYPTENVYQVIFHNLIDIAVATVSYFLVGFAFAFGKNDFFGFSSYGPWFNIRQMDLHMIFYGYSAVLIGTCIITMQLCGRLHMFGSILVTFIYSAFMLPVTMHWVWHDKGWMKYFQFYNSTYHYVDYGGAAVIHSTSGIIGLIGSAFLGRRILQLREIDKASIGVESPGSTILGYFLMCCGFLAMLLPYKINDEQQLCKILINGITTIGFGIMCMLFIQKIASPKQNYWVLVSSMQGGIAALVMVSAGIQNYSVITCIIITLTFIPTQYIIPKLVKASPLEDHCNVIALHLTAGVLGVVPVHLLGENKTEHYNSYILQTIWQIVGTFIILKAHEITFALVFLLLSCTSCLRNSLEDNCHKRSLKYAEHVKKRVFDFQKGNIVLEPCTDRYNPIKQHHSSCATNLDCLNISNCNIQHRELAEKRSELVLCEEQDEAVIYKLDDLIHSKEPDDCSEDSGRVMSEKNVADKDLEIASNGYCTKCQSKIYFGSSFGSD